MTRHTRPLEPGPRGRVIAYACMGCGDRTSAYEGERPGTLSAPWVVDADRAAWCPRCARERDVSPSSVRCVTCGARAAKAPDDWVLFRGAWYCGPCADRPRRNRRP